MYCPILLEEILKVFWQFEFNYNKNNYGLLSVLYKVLQYTRNQNEQ